MWELGYVTYTRSECLDSNTWLCTAEASYSQLHINLSSRSLYTIHFRPRTYLRSMIERKRTPALHVVVPAPAQRIVRADNDLIPDPFSACKHAH